MTAAQGAFPHLAMTPPDIQLISHGTQRASSSGPERIDDVCYEAADVHRHEELLSRIAAKGVAPFAADTDIFDMFILSHSEDDIRNAFISTLIRRLGVPPWFAAAMTLQDLVRTWGFALSCLTTREGHRVVLADAPEHILKRTASLYLAHLDGQTAVQDSRRDYIQTPQQVWGNGPVGLTVYIPLVLCEAEEVEGQAEPNWYSLHLGWVGGHHGGFVEDLGNDLRHYEADHAAAAVVPPNPPRLMQIAARQRTHAGYAWELNYNGGR